MTSIHYLSAASGGWLGLVRDRLALVVATPRDVAFVDSAWSTMNRPYALQPLLDLLTSNGLSATPSFALIEWDDTESEVRAIVRGDARLTVTDAAGGHQLVGNGVSTWREHSFTGVADVSLEVDGSTADDTSLWLPIAAGAGWCAALTVAFGAVTPTVPDAASDAAYDSEPDELTLVGSPTDDAPGAPATAPVGITPSAGQDTAIGDTVFRPRPGSGNQVATVVDEPVDDAIDGDHDGETVMTRHLADLRKGRAVDDQKSAAPTPSASPLPTVVLVLPDGTREPLSQPILIGRAPSVEKVSGGALPRLIAIGSGDQDISRNHARVTLEGDTVVVTDLHSRNGTHFVLPGKPPQKLRAGEPTAVIVGTVIDLGGGIALTVDEAH